MDTKLGMLQRLSKKSLRETVGYDVAVASFTSPSGQVSVQVWDINMKLGRAYEFCSDAHVAIILLDSDASGSVESASGYVKALDGVTTIDLPKFVMVIGKASLTDEEKKELSAALRGEKNVKVVSSRLDRWDEIEKSLTLAALTAMRSPAWEETKEKDRDKSMFLKVVVLGDERRLFWKQSR